MSAPGVGTDQFHPGGFIASDTAGRTDRLPLSVPAESHVMPADVVSGLGQGNSLNGTKILDAMFPTQQAGAPRAAGGAAPGVSKVLLAGGEYVVPADQVAAIGKRMRAAGKSKARTDLKAGHEALDDLIGRVRKQAMQFLRSAPAPKK